MESKLQAGKGRDSPWLEESVSADQIVLQVQGQDLQIRDKVIDIKELGLLKKEQINLLRDLGIAAWRPDIPPVIDEVLPDGAAWEAGLQAEDKVFITRPC